tara:strand:+ start:1349 stop:1594 length:246 start_codon:yes stop_codon:yes gene_type:complete
MGVIMKRIQVMVENDLYAKMVDSSHQKGLSLSSFTRLVLLNTFKKKVKMSVLDEALIDLEKGDVEEFTLEQFNKQIDDLLE